MTAGFRWRQIRIIAGAELRRAFFSKRAFWVYFLALFPSFIFFGHSLDKTLKAKRWPKVEVALLDTVHEGETMEAVEQRLGVAVTRERWKNRRTGEDHRFLIYFDGRRRLHIDSRNGIVMRASIHSMFTFEEDRQVFAVVFQYFYLRLAIFFGCLGIFMNLFRGEMLDKTLHFWFLAPVRRDVLLAGKYLAGVAASTVIFTAGAAFAFGMMLWGQFPGEARMYWAEGGAGNLLWYLIAAVLGCVGYGSVFLGAGLLLRNPIVPAAILLLWEGINGFLPATLQKLSVIYYLQSLCPVAVAMPGEMPALVRILLAPAEPASAAGAVLGLAVVTALVLWLAARAVPRIEINYGTE